MKESGVGGKYSTILLSRMFCTIGIIRALSSATSFYRFGAPGSPDIICVVDGRYVAIEVKAEKGRQSEHQKEFQKNLEAAGGTYWRILLMM